MGKVVKFTHLDESGSVKMVDVSGKNITRRVAVARSFIQMKASVLESIKSGDNKKGNVFAVARVAGIMAAKKTSDLIPMCHPLALTSVAIDLCINYEKLGVDITATCRTNDKTGVEMEALTAVSVSALTLYDMCKALDKTMVIEKTELISKSGGKSDYY